MFVFTSAHVRIRTSYDSDDYASNVIAALYTSPLTILKKKRVFVLWMSVIYRLFFLSPALIKGVVIYDRMDVDLLT